VEIDWDDYVIGNDWVDTGKRFVYHDVKGCPDTSEEGLFSLQEFIDWALEHHEICKKEN
jgi:hypothetical protein